MRAEVSSSIFTPTLFFNTSTCLIPSHPYPIVTHKLNINAFKPKKIDFEEHPSYLLSFYLHVVFGLSCVIGTCKRNMGSYTRTSKRGFWEFHFLLACWHSSILWILLPFFVLVTYYRVKTLRVSKLGMLECMLVLLPP